MTRPHRPLSSPLCELDGCERTRDPHSKRCSEHRAEARAARRTRYEASYPGRNPGRKTTFDHKRRGSPVEEGHLVWIDAEGGYVEAKAGEPSVVRDGMRLGAATGLDGELIPRHVTPFLGVRDWEERYEALLYRPNGISTYDYLNSLLEYSARFAHPIRFVMYGSDYDLTRALKDLPERAKLELLNGGIPVRERPLIGQWEKRYEFLLKEAKDRRSYFKSLRGRERAIYSDLEWMIDIDLPLHMRVELQADLKDLRILRATALLNRTRTHVVLPGPDGTRQCWYIEWIPGKYLVASLMASLPPGSSRWVRADRDRAPIRVDDILSNFQSSFLHAVLEWFPDSQKDIDRVERGKERRGSFVFPRDLAEVEDYNRVESLWGLRLAKALLKADQAFFQELVAQGVLLERPPLRTLYGPAALAKVTLRALEAADWMGKIGIDIPPEAHTLALASYMAGRIEMVLQRVIEGPLYDYDRSSSYPDLIARLPAMPGGKWVHTRSWHPEWVWSFYRIRYRFDVCNLPVYPFAIRTPNGLQFVPWAETTVTGFELEAALETLASDATRRQNEERRARNEHTFAFGGKGHEDWRGRVEILDAWHFIPSAKEQANPSWSVFRRLAVLRLSLKEQKNPAHRAAKLILNSVYGCLAQSIMFHSAIRNRSDGDAPPFFQIEYAAWITGWTRAEVWRVCAKDPRNVVAISTDGVLTKGPCHIVDEDFVNGERKKRGLPPLSEDTARSGDALEDNRLGAWSLKNVASRAIVVQAGVYALEIGGKWIPLSRGFRREQGVDEADEESKGVEELRAERLFQTVFNPIIEAWARGETEVFLPQRERMLTLHEAMLADHPGLAGAFVRPPKRRLAIIAPLDRDPRGINEKRMLYERPPPGTDELRTYPRWRGTMEESVPYQPDFQRERSFFDEVEMNEIVDLVKSGKAVPITASPGDGQQLSPDLPVEANRTPFNRPTARIEEGVCANA